MSSDTEIATPRTFNGVPQGMALICASPNGAWVKIAKQEAAADAGLLSRTGIRLFIDAGKKIDPSDGSVSPHFYLLLDSAEAPTRAHVAFAALTKAQAESGLVPKFIAPHGHATGYRNVNPYPEFAEDIDLLVQREALEFRPNYMGRLVEPCGVIGFGRRLDGAGPGWENSTPEDAEGYLISRISDKGSETFVGVVEFGEDRTLRDVLGSLRASFPEDFNRISFRINDHDAGEANEVVEPRVLKWTLEGAEGQRREALQALYSEYELLSSPPETDPDEDGLSPN